MRQTGSCWLGLGIALAGLAPGTARGGEVDLRRAVIVTPARLSPQEQKAVALLVEEVHKRTWVRWPVVYAWPEAAMPVIAVGPAAALKELAGPFAEKRAGHPAVGAEGFRIDVETSGRAAPAVVVAGNDARGVLFGVGRLLRELHMERGVVALADNLHIVTAPKFSLRGHQLGYRPKTNSYDGWDLPQWEQYIRDLAVFGSNAVELIPPRSDDDRDSPHFPRPPMDMMIGMSQLLDDYGLDVWIWYPALDADYTNPKTVELALQEWGEVFRRLPRIDAVFVPGGDPGETRPKVLLVLLEKQAANLHRYHPRAKLWVSPQSFTRAWLDEFIQLLHDQPLPWLAGVVYGPEVRISLPELRRVVPARFPIRRYPDITHSLRCQYPVPDWDLAYALTLGREPINPRPRNQATIFRAFQDQAIGFITYSEGCNDDVNKIVWSCLGWDPGADMVDILRQYSRYFLGERYRDDFAQGLLALERNWRGPLLTNAGVETTLRQFQALEQSASPQTRLNWRFQQALYRAYYDAYQYRRLLHETDLEARALERLREAHRLGSLTAMTQAEEILRRADADPVAPQWRARVFELAEALFQSIRMQLSVERYQASAVGRGATLDTVDVPLNNRRWLVERFAELRQREDESARLRGIDAILHWDDPGPGGFYDDLGNPSRQEHLVRGARYAVDPGMLQSPASGNGYESNWRLSWCSHAEALYDAPVRLHYRGLDSHAHYAVRVVYAGNNFSNRVRLAANEQVEIHPFIAKPVPVRPLEFDLPAQATAPGELTLTWTQEPGRGGNGRSCQIAEVWLIKREAVSGPPSRANR